MFSSITGKNLREFKISVPPLTEQKRIVNLISSVDSYIEALQQQIDKARKSRNAVLHELLTKGGDGWVETKLGEVIEHTIGGAWGGEPGSQEVNVHVVRSTEFTKSGYLNFNTGVTRSIKDSQLKSRELKSGDILLEKSGGGPDQPVGRVVFVTSEIPEKTVCSNFVQLIRPDNDQVNSFFLFLVLWRWHSINRTLEFQAQTTGIRNLRTPDYLEQTFKLPPLVEQKRIVEIMSVFDNQIEALDSTIAKTQNLRSALLSDLLSGNHEIPTTYDKLIGAA
jgi:type I restriction enzyme S subunit